MYKDLVQAQLAASVQESLALKLVDNARFLCERLVAANRAEVRPIMCVVHFLAMFARLALPRRWSHPLAVRIFALIAAPGPLSGAAGSQTAAGRMLFGE